MMINTSASAFYTLLGPWRHAMQDYYQNNHITGEM